MAKSKKKTVFFCKQCGYESSKWLGQCPGCHEWDSFVEEPVAKAVPGVSGTVSATKKDAVPTLLSNVTTDDENIRDGQSSRRRYCCRFACARGR